jgi:hypothetical protein
LKSLYKFNYLNTPYQNIRANHFYENFFYENYKTDIADYYIITNLNYKIFINNNFLKKKKSFYFINPNKDKSIIFNQNRNNLDKLINVSFSDGKKLKFLNYINYLNNAFYYSFIYKSSFFQSRFENYMLFYNFSKENDFFFDLDFILNNIVNLNESIFNIKVIKLNKKLKKRFKKKFDFEVRYLRKHKRSLNVFKSLHLYSNSFNYYKYYERLLASLLLTFLNQKESKIYKRKLVSYSLVLKKKSL